MNNSNNLKEAYQETVVNLISNSKYIDLSFYGFILAKLNVHFEEDFPTLGVKFNAEKLNYDLIIGNYFLNLTKEEKIAVLIHECRHIIGLHTIRKEDRDHKLFNIAADISINQLIKNLPEGALYPETFDFPRNESSETYYELLKEEQEKQESEGQGTNSKGELKPDLTNIDENSETLDVHDWDESSEANCELQKSLTKQIVKEAIEQSRGNLPSDINNILELFKSKSKISWKKELRKILSSRNGSKIETIKRKNRRFPHRADLRGKKVYKDKPTIIVGIDTSGSMSDDDVLNGLVEINDVIKNIGELKVIQIDTEIKGIENFNKTNFKFIHRKGYGGTYMGECPKYILNNNLKCDALIMISDMFIENLNNDINWNSFNKPVIWLNTSGTKVNLPKNHKIFNIKE